jgi:hypothetical protein
VSGDGEELDGVYARLYRLTTPASLDRPTDHDGAVELAGSLAA